MLRTASPPWICWLLREHALESEGPEDVLSLVQSASDGGAGAIEALLARYLPDLELYVARHAGPLLRARESSTDLAQSVCREVLEHLRGGRLRFRGEAPFRAWLYRAAALKLAQRRRFWGAGRRDPGREHAPAAERDDSVAPAELFVDSATPSRAARREEELERLAEVFAALSPEHQEIVELVHVEGLSHAEVAARKGISESYSRTLLARALARLARLGTMSEL